jgi:hypothetical protein
VRLSLVRGAPLARKELEVRARVNGRVVLDVHGVLGAVVVLRGARRRGAPVRVAAVGGVAAGAGAPPPDVGGAAALVDLKVEHAAHRGAGEDLALAHAAAAPDLVLVAVGLAIVDGAVDRRVVDVDGAGVGPAPAVEAADAPAGAAAEEGVGDVGDLAVGNGNDGTGGLGEQVLAGVAALVCMQVTQW